LHHIFARLGSNSRTCAERAAASSMQPQILIGLWGHTEEAKSNLLNAAIQHPKLKKRAAGPINELTRSMRKELQQKSWCACAPPGIWAAMPRSLYWFWRAKCNNIEQSLL